MDKGAMNVYPPALLSLSVYGAQDLPKSSLSVGQIRGSLSSPNIQIWLLMGLCFNPVCYLSREKADGAVPEGLTACGPGALSVIQGRQFTSLLF